MQELEKILEDINDRFENLTIADDECRKTALSKHNYEQVKYFQNAMFYTERAKGIVEEIIHKHMGNDGWIPVEEHLPEDGQIVIISMYNNIKWVTIGSQCGGVWKPYNYITDLGIDVKAWRYLPDPYRSEKGE